MANLDEQWENGELGRDERFVQKSNATSQSAIDEMLALQAISIRLPKGLLQDLKNIAELNGIGYQPLIKQILNRFIDGEKKMMANEKIQEELAKMKKIA
ncbi:BrnA antitoxin family protein [Neisseria sp. ZJ106]|uniref:BrnA antitoxin family protein n=1 Tax=Neisseria lisongii TaxID=2912188 RepID=A0ABY7RJR4_9NEIS|nr:BrnA antitoxin family protein [Neisseria lisongii]MCF7520534.1 BrnA antitoxin family protein [Neisseria lisongii]WCL71527.1 BrnA antitoxin family protein [Neisseria lisongii]